MTHEIIVTIPQQTYESYSRFMDALFSCGAPNIDWTCTSRHDTTPDKSYIVHTTMVETVRDICANQGLRMQDVTEEKKFKGKGARHD